MPQRMDIDDHTEKSQRKLQNNPSVRLVNPAKNEHGRFSKFVIQAVNRELRHKFNLKQWKNTDDVIDWFKSINEK